MTRVFIVDDSLLARKTLVKSLPAELVVDVTQFSNGEAVVSACRTSAPEILFLDLNMPGLDGYGVLEELEGSLPKHVIVLSADIQPLARARVLALGASAFVPKPAERRFVEAALRTSGAIS